MVSWSSNISHLAEIGGTFLKLYWKVLAWTWGLPSVIAGFCAYLSIYSSIASPDEASAWWFKALPWILGVGGFTCGFIATYIIVSKERPPLNIVVDASSVSVGPLMVTPPTNSQADGKIFYIRHVLITNRASGSRVSLKVELKIILGVGNYLLLQTEESTLRNMNLGGEYIECPLSLGPQDSKKCNFRFWVPLQLQVLLGPNLANLPDIARPYEHKLKTSLEVEDHISGERVSVPIPGRYP